MRSINWQPDELSQIEADWRAGVPLNTICARYHRGTGQITELARREGWERGARPPLVAGHPLTWGLLACGASFADARGNLVDGGFAQ